MIEFPRCGSGEIHAGNWIAGTRIHPAGPGRPHRILKHAAQPWPIDPLFLPRGFHAGMHSRSLHAPRPALRHIEGGTCRGRREPTAARTSHGISREVPTPLHSVVGCREIRDQDVRREWTPRTGGPARHLSDRPGAPDPRRRARRFPDKPTRGLHPKSDHAERQRAPYLVFHAQEARLPERGDAQYVERVVFVIPDGWHVNVPELVDQLRHGIAVSDDEHATALVLMQHARGQTLGVCGRDYHRLLTKTLGERRRCLLRTACIADINRIDAPYPLTPAKHLSQPLRA